MKIKLITKFNMREIFAFAYWLYIISNVLLETQLIDSQSVSIGLRLIKYLGIAIVWAMCLQKKRGNKRVFVIMLIMLVPAFLNTVLLSGGSMLFEIAIILISYSMINFEIDYVFKHTIYALIFGHVGVILLCKVGILEDEVTSRWFGSYMGALAGEQVRHGMGFLASNQIPLTLMLIYFMLITLKGNNIKFWMNVIVIALALVSWNLFGSRISLGLIIFAVLCYYGVRFGEKHLRLKKLPNFMWLSFVICAAISILCATMYNSNNAIWYLINDIFYNRLRWSHAALAKYSVTFLGQGLEVGYSTGLNGENIVDNGYVLILLQRGLFLSCFIIVAWTYLGYKARQSNKLYLSLSVALIAIACLIDNHLTSYKMVPYYCLMVNYLKRYKTFSSKYHHLNSQ